MTHMLEVLERQADMPHVRLPREEWEQLRCDLENARAYIAMREETRLAVSTAAGLGRFSHTIAQLLEMGAR